MTLTEVIKKSDRERFYKFAEQVDPASCWEWTSVRNRSGYGKFWLNGRTDLAHRVSYKIAKGPIPADLMVRHSCDNPPCVNPDHLLLGTGKDNARDALERHRYKRGVDNAQAKLTDESVMEIRQAWRAGETQVSLGRRFGVSRAAIQFVLSGRSWAHIEEAS